MENMVTFHRVTLNWEKRDYNGPLNDPGVYQIYGMSPIYGVDTLLYIGQTTKSKQRLSQHFDNELGFIGRQPNKTCRFAKLQPDLKVGEMSPNDLLTAIEEILIVMHKPSFNSQRLINVSAPTKNHWIYIQNHGERGVLNLEVTNYYFKQFSSEQTI